MRSLKAPGSLLKVQSLPPCTTRPLQARPFCLLPSNSLSFKQNFGLSCSNPSSVSSRYSRQCSHSPFQDVLGCFVPGISQSCDEPTCKPAIEPRPIPDDIYVFDQSTVNNDSTLGDHMVASNTSCWNWLKFVLLSGYLMLRGCQLAVAETEFSNGVQSIPYIGDLGDICTGLLAHIFL